MVATFGCLAQSGFPMVMSLAISRGQGTYARQPDSPSGFFHVSIRSPLMAKGRPMACETRSFRYGFARFQSNVSTKMTAAATMTTGVMTSPRASLPDVRIVVLLVLAQKCDCAR